MTAIHAMLLAYVPLAKRAIPYLVTLVFATHLVDSI